MKQFGEYSIDSHLQRIGASLQNGSSCLIKAEPGAGKTTRVPLFLLSVIPGEILVLEPRRLAARLSAERCAWFLDEPCGRHVGFIIRQDRKISRDTRLTFITEGLFLRLLRTNPSLKGIGAVVIDEFHERNIYTDIALALVRRLQQTVRPDLKLAVMSATLDTPGLEKYLEDAGGVDVFDIEGRTFPVDIEYFPGENSSLPMGRNWLVKVSAAIRKMVGDPRCPGDILVFLTGLGDILELKQVLEKEIPGPGFSILPLAADLPLKDQQRVFEAGVGRKIVLSTNVAETSLTIPGITGVIDLGLAKIPALAPWSGMPTLEIKRISQASAVQRAGRAGRTRGGVVFRLFSKPEFLNRDAFTPPDIRRIDIVHPLLDLMNLGFSLDIMPWFEPPEEKNLESALQLLTFLGAMDGSGKITGFGEKLSVLPLHPRLSAVAMAGLENGCAEDALLAACLISERFVLKSGSFVLQGDDPGEPCDLSMQMDILKAVVFKKDEISPYSSWFLDIKKQKRVLDLYRTLAGVCRISPVLSSHKTDAKKLSVCLLRGFPDRVAQRRDFPGKKKVKGPGGVYNFCLGRGGEIAKSSVVYPGKPRYLIAVEAVENVKKDAARGISILVCASLDPVVGDHTLRRSFGPSLGALIGAPGLPIISSDTTKDINSNAVSDLSSNKSFWGSRTLFSKRGLVAEGLLRYERRVEPDPAAGTSVVWQDLFYGNLKIESQKIGLLVKGQNLSRALAENWPFPFPDDVPLKIYHRRVELLNLFEIPNQCPVFSGEMLELFFEFICVGIGSLNELLDKPLEEYIYRQLSANDRAVLETYVPLELKLKNGKRLKIHYREGIEPWAEVFLQDCYGLKETPSILHGKQRVILHLLGPNRREVQVTGDLAGFWPGSYYEVRKELSRRYPKHYWPENPAQAEPIILKRWIK